MKTFRSILVLISFFVFGIGSVILNLFVFPVLKLVLKVDDFQILASKIIQFAWSLFIRFLSDIRLIKINLKNKEKLADISGGKVIVASHPSFIDILILMSLISKSTCFIKSSLAKNKVFKNIVNSIFITNDTDFDEVKSTTKEFLEKGFNIIVFPMGSRHRENEYPKIKKGASMIALHSGKNIVPIKISASEDFLFANQPFWQGGAKRVAFDIEVLEEIEVKNFVCGNEIVEKREITKAITSALYK